MEVILGIAQAFLLKRVLSQKQRIGWVIVTVIGSKIISYLRDILFFLFAIKDINQPIATTSTWDSYLISIQSGVIGGLIGGGIMGLIQVICTPLKPMWVIFNAVAWALAWASAWIVVTAIGYSGLLQSVTIFLPILQMMSHGLVVGLVSSSISGLGLLTCFTRSPSTPRNIP